MESHRAKTMYDYHVWANKQLIKHLKQLREHVYHEHVKSVFDSISEVMTHIYGADIVWLETMKGSTFEESAEEVARRKAAVSGVSINEMESCYDALSEEYDRFFAEQDDLERTIVVEHPKRGQMSFVLADLIHHVVNHGTYHRGNVTAMLHQQGEQGVPTDYVSFCMNKG
ncbi:DinB family protein [Shouchella lonarensis]|uniref:Uncharacterized damage-inducible protein DinB (Forms a four-helix bundle) n=1 Tax=Shouchella lonarensis TaxID=1464122 RepID=A0A1G6HXL4_9BACI|nr:DinB family protein [Shouchella lonarensis]SDB98883.1 Uncharacterized damage-inducible protein DinB (forms a four-helix bundle) [Shouchella lonarensis]